MPIPCGTTSRRSSRGAGRVRPRPTWRSACHPYESGNRRDAAIAVRSGYLVRGVRPDHRDFLARSGDRRHRGARRQEPRMSRTALGVAAVPQPAGSRAGGGRAPVSRGADPRAAVHAPVAPVRRPARGAERDRVPLRTAASGHQVRRVDRTDAGRARRPDPPPTAASSEPPSRTCRSTPCATWRASWSASPPSSWATAAWRNCGTSPSARAVPGTRRRMRPSATWCSASCPGPTRRVSPPLAAPVVQPSLRRIHCTLSFIRLYKRSQSASQLLHGFGDFPPRGLADVLALFRIDSM